MKKGKHLWVVTTAPEGDLRDKSSHFITTDKIEFHTAAAKALALDGKRAVGSVVTLVEYSGRIDA